MSRLGATKLGSGVGLPPKSGRSQPRPRQRYRTTGCEGGAAARAVSGARRCEEGVKRGGVKWGMKRGGVKRGVKRGVRCFEEGSAEREWSMHMRMHMHMHMHMQV